MASTDSVSAPKRKTNNNGSDRLKGKFFEKFPVTDHYVQSDGYKLELPGRFKGRGVIVTGSVDHAAMEAQMWDENYRPVNVGGKAAVSLWLIDWMDSSGDGQYYEIIMTVAATKNKFVTYPYENDFSLLLQGKPDVATMMYRLYLSETVPIIAGRTLWGFPKHPHPADISVFTNADGNFICKAAAGEKSVLSAKIQLPTENPMELEAVMNMVTPANLIFESNMMNPYHGTLLVKPWNSKTDMLALGSDDYLGGLAGKLAFDPKVVCHWSTIEFSLPLPTNWA